MYVSTFVLYVQYTPGITMDIELLHYGVASVISKFLPIVDVSSLRAANSYFMWTVDGIYESEMKTFALKFGIEVYKSDVEVERELRSLLMGFLRLKEHVINDSMDLIHQDIYALFERIQRESQQHLHLPKLTLKILRMRDSLTFEDGEGFIRKILTDPQIYRECLKFLTTEFYRIHRIELTDKLMEDLGIFSEDVKHLELYQKTCLLKSQFKTGFYFVPKYLVSLYAINLLWLSICGKSRMEAMEDYVKLFQVSYFFLAFFRYCWEFLKRYDSFSD